MGKGCCRCGPFKVDIVPRGLLRPFILDLLSEEPMHGFEIMEQIFEKTDGMWRPGPAAVYPTLFQLENNGYIESVEKEKQYETAKKEYKITEKGIQALKEYKNSKKDISSRMKNFNEIFNNF